MRILALLFITLNSAIVSGQLAEFSFLEKSVYKADEIKEGEQLNYTWNFINTGDAPLIITGYDVECSCTKITYSKAPIAPGDTSQINLSFDSNGKIGWQYRKILIKANVKKGVEEVEFRVKVNND